MPHVAPVRTACDGGDLDACVAFGLLLDDGIGLAADPTGAVALFRKACDGGNLKGCGNLGRMYANGKGIGKDEALPQGLR